MLTVGKRMAGQIRLKREAKYGRPNAEQHHTKTPNIGIAKKEKKKPKSIFVQSS